MLRSLFLSLLLLVTYQVSSSFSSFSSFYPTSSSSNPTLLPAVDLRCEHLLSPLGVDTLSPLLTWVPLVDTLTTKSITQASFVIDIALTPSFTPILYTTGNVTSNQTVYTVPSNVLNYDTTYYWRITYAGCTVNIENQCITPSSSVLSLPSLPATFTTSVSAVQWTNAPFLSCKTVGACDFVRSPVFTIPGTPVRAMLHLATAGWIEAYVNGYKAGTDIVLEGSWTQYNVRLPTTTYNVTDYVTAGSNVIGLFLGNGWWGHLGHRATGSIILSVTLADTSVHYYYPNASTWYGNSGPIEADDIYNGETYDLRQERLNWSTVNYSLNGWDSTTIVPDPILTSTSLTWQKVAPVIARRNANQIIPSVGINQPPGSNQYVVDYGINSAGWTRFILPPNCPTGTAIALMHSENLFANGTIDQGNLRTARATDTIVCDGRNTSYIYEPRFTYHGFRYIGIDTWPISSFPVPDTSMFYKIELHNAVEWDITMPTNSPLPSSSIQFGNGNASSPSVLNIVQTMIVRGQLSNLHGGVPTDCPNRDERQGWAFDGSVSAESASSNLDMQAFYQGWLEAIVDAQNSATVLNDCDPSSPIYPDCNGAVCDTNPHMSGLFGYQPADVSWGGAINVIFDLLIRHYHDWETLNRFTPAIFGWADYLLRVAAKSSHVGLVTYHWYGDWLQPNKVASDELTSQQTSAFSFLLTLRAAITAAELTNSSTAQTRYRNAYALGSQVYNQVFFNMSGNNCYGSGSQAEQVYPSYLEIPLPTMYATLDDFVSACLLPAIALTNSHVDTGIVSTKYLLQVLSRVERTDVALTLALQEDFPSWGAMNLVFNQTTITEHWNPVDNPSGDAMSSRNHPAFSSIGSWFYQALLGIRSGDTISVNFSGPGLPPDRSVPATNFINEFGFRNILLSPEYVTNPKLTSVSGGMRSINGYIGMNWNIDVNNNNFFLNTTLPVATYGTVRTPSGGPWNSSTLTITETGLCTGTVVWRNGNYVNNNNCLGIYDGYVCGRFNDRVCLSIGNGNYQFMITTP